VTICKRLEQDGFAWPKVGCGVMRLWRVQFEALFAG
jgi:transposase